MDPSMFPAAAWDHRHQRGVWRQHNSIMDIKVFSFIWFKCQSNFLGFKFKVVPVLIFSLKDARVDIFYFVEETSEAIMKTLLV